MLNLPYAEVTWALNSYCTLQCDYCPPEWKSGNVDHTIDKYLSIVKKLQDTRYQHHQNIYWRITGGEPLNFPELSTLLKAIKLQPSIVEIETSGEIEWFSFTRITKLIDKVQLTYHRWQNDDVFDFVLEQCTENNISVNITVPLYPGAIYESRERIQKFKALGYTVIEQKLLSPGGQDYKGYTQVDLNRINGMPDDWEPEPVFLDPNLPPPNYIDLSVITDTSLVYTGKPCYAGVDWININHKGFVQYSHCNGRNESLNAFNPEWQPPSTHFPCNINQCRSEQDRTKIRIHTS